MGLGFHLLALAHTLALAWVLHRQKQRAALAIEAGPAKLTPHRTDRKAEGLSRHCTFARQQPAAVVAEHIEVRIPRAIGHQPEVAGWVEGEVVGMAKTEPTLPGQAASGHHPPAEAGASASATIAQAHHPTVGPEGFAFGAAKDRRITAAAVITARRRESDQQVAVDRVDIGVFWPGAGGGTSSVGG